MDESDEQYGLRVANELEEKILELGPDSVGAFIAETVVGSHPNDPTDKDVGWTVEIADPWGNVIGLTDYTAG